MKLKIPPALVFFLFGSAMYFLATYLPVGNFDFFGRRFLIVVMVLMAFLLVILALYQFYKAKTTVDPTAPSKATALVTKGVYQYSRNPMYLTLLLLLLAWGLWLGNAFNTLLAALFVAYMNRFQIQAEEQSLQQIFGKEYQLYCSQVRRWF